MTSPTQILPLVEAVQYNGTNGTYIATGFVPDGTIVSDNGTLLIFTRPDDGGTYYINLTDWAVFSRGNIYDVRPDAEFNTLYYIP